MQRYLIYDASCSVCRELSEVVRDMAHDRLALLHIRDVEAVALLNRAYPHGWQPAPYMVFAEPDRVRAWTGPATGYQLARTIGLRGAWRVWCAARRHGIYLPPGRTNGSRRRFLRLSAGLAATLVGIGVLPRAVAAAACDDDYCYIGPCEGVSVCGYPPQVFYCDRYDCYANSTGEYCRTTYNNCGCGFCI